MKDNTMSREDADGNNLLNITTFQNNKKKMDKEKEGKREDANMSYINALAQQ